MNADAPFLWNFSKASPRLPKIVTSTKVGSSRHWSVCWSLTRRFTASPTLQTAMLLCV